MGGPSMPEGGSGNAAPPGSISHDEEGGSGNAAPPGSGPHGEGGGSAPSRRWDEAAVEDDMDKKRSVLLDIYDMESKGTVFTKRWTMEDRLEDMLLEVRRHVMAKDECRNVSMMKEGLRLFVTGVELVNNRFGLLDLEGWSSDVSRELGKHDDNLGRIYRKYCRRSTSRSPEAEIAMALVSSMGMHHVKRVMAKTVINRVSTAPPAQSRRRAPVAANLPKHLDEDSSSEEDVPNAVRS